MTMLESLYNEWKSLQPLRDEDANRLRQKFMLEFNYNSNHIYIYGKDNCSRHRDYSHKCKW